jgi:hypothetical protein
MPIILPGHRTAIQRVPLLRNTLLSQVCRRPGKVEEDSEMTFWRQ